MSKLAEKIFRGETPTAEDWQDHLLKAHAQAPGMTPKAFADYKTADGRNSYDILTEDTQIVKRSDAVLLDLACGDGYLSKILLPKLGPAARIAGIDMSPEELDLGRANINDPRMLFICAKADRMPVESSSIELALCHMAFMLMSPIEPVIHELHRVLVPGGRFSAVIGGPTAKEGFDFEIGTLIRNFLVSRYPVAKGLTAGDARVRTKEGLSELFTSEGGFASVGPIVDFNLQLVVTPLGVWDFMKDMYLISFLPAAQRAELEEEIIQFSRKWAAGKETVSFEFPMRKFTVTKK
jgi:SAM-dependent methyltransferase